MIRRLLICAVLALLLTPAFAQGLVPDMNWSGRFARETEGRWDGDDHVVGIEGVRDCFLDCLWDIDLKPPIAEAEQASGIRDVWTGMVTVELKKFDIWK